MTKKHIKLDREKDARAPTQNPPNKLELLGWGQFDEYLEFVDWIEEEDCKFVTIKLLQDAPQEYKNKWGRTQYKMKVYQYETNDKRTLSAGKRLWGTIKNFLVENQIPPCGTKIQITRTGSGFDTQYQVKFP